MFTHFIYMVSFKAIILTENQSKWKTTLFGIYFLIASGIIIKTMRATSLLI